MLLEVPDIRPQLRMRHQPGMQPRRPLHPAPRRQQQKRSGRQHRQEHSRHSQSQRHCTQYDQQIIHDSNSRPKSNKNHLCRLLPAILSILLSTTAANPAIRCRCGSHFPHVPSPQTPVRHLSSVSLFHNGSKTYVSVPLRKPPSICNGWYFAKQQKLRALCRSLELQIPDGCCCWKKMITFVTLLALMWVTEHIDESVFVISFQENVVVFKESKDCGSTVICIRLRVFYAIDTGVGIVSVYLLSGLTTTFLEIGGRSSTLSLL